MGLCWPQGRLKAHESVFFSAVFFSFYQILSSGTLLLLFSKYVLKKVWGTSDGYTMWSPSRIATLLKWWNSRRIGWSGGWGKNSYYWCPWNLICQWPRSAYHHTVWKWGSNTTVHPGMGKSSLHQDNLLSHMQQPRFYASYDFNLSRSLRSPFPTLSI